MQEEIVYNFLVKKTLEHYFVPEEITFSRRHKDEMIKISTKNLNENKIAHWFQIPPIAHGQKETRHKTDFKL